MANLGKTEICWVLRQVKMALWRAGPRKPKGRVTDAMQLRGGRANTVRTDLQSKGNEKRRRKCKGNCQAQGVERIC